MKIQETTFPMLVVLSSFIVEYGKKNLFLIRIFEYYSNTHTNIRISMWVFVDILNKNLCCGCSLESEAILRSTHNIGFYEDLTKIIFELSSNTCIISSAVETDLHLHLCCMHIAQEMFNHRMVLLDIRYIFLNTRQALKSRVKSTRVN